MSISLVVTDLDQTLWDRDERIHDRTLAALRELRARRLPVLVATGRRLRSAHKRLGADKLSLPVVALDGAIGRDGDRTFHHRSFTPEQAERLIQTFADGGISPCVYVDDVDRDVIIGSVPSTHADHLRMIADSSSTVADLGQVAREHPIHAVGAYGVTGPAGENLARLAAATPGHYELQGGWDPFFGGFSLVLYPKGTTKWAGVQSFCIDQGLDVNSVLAIGDGPNDLELLEGASVACVVSDGCDEALALADHVFHPASQGGWGAVLDLV